MAKKSLRKRMIESLRFAQDNLPHFPYRGDATYTGDDIREYRKQKGELYSILDEVDNKNE